MESAVTDSGKQGERSKSKTVVPIQYITDLGFTDYKTKNTADAAESDGVNSESPL